MNNAKRATNFSAKEESLLVTLVKKYKHKIECKKSDTDTNRLKREAWISIEKEFNSLSGEIHRDDRTLKNKYENIKKRCKKKYADEKCQRFGTGGGPYKPTTITKVEEERKEILGARLDGCVSEFDNDAKVTTVELTDNSTDDNGHTQETSLDFEQTPHFENSTNNIEIAVEDPSSFQQKDISHNWSKPSPQQLRTPKSIPLRVHKKEVQIQKKETTQKLMAWASSKVAVESVKERCILEEHELKLKLMQEKHNKELEIMEQEFQQRAKHRAEIHELQKFLLHAEKKNQNSKYLNM